MKRAFTLFTCVVLLSVGVTQSSHAYNPPKPTIPELMAGSSLNERDGIYFLRLQGTPYQMGFQHGRLLRKQIRALYQEYLVRWLKGQTGGGAKYRRAYSVFRKSAHEMEKYIPDEYLQEMRGIAEGSGVPYRQVLVMHTYLDTVSNPHLIKEPMLLCTNFMTTRQASKEGRLIHGRNLAWPTRDILDRNLTVILYQPSQGNRMVAMSWPGVCGVLTGMNDQGVTLAQTSVVSTESTSHGIPAFILFRSALQHSRTMYDVIRYIGSSRRTTGYTLGVADGKLKRACVIECTGWRYDVRFTAEDFVIGANHFLDADLAKTMKESELGDIDSKRRARRIEELIRRNYGKVDREIAQRFLSDPVMNTPGTFLSVVFEPEQLKAFLAVGHKNIAQGMFFPIDLRAELGVKLPVPEELPDPEKYFSYDKAPGKEERKLTDQTGAYRKYQVNIPTGGNSTLFENTIYLNYYEPKGKKDFPVVIILPHFTGSKAFIEGRFAEKFASDGIGAVVVDMAFQKKGTTWLGKQLKYGDLGQLTGMFREIILNARRTLDWLETQPGIDMKRVGLMGISLGAIAAPIVIGNDNRVKAAAYVLGGGDIPTILYNAKEAEFFKKRLTRDNISEEEFRRKFAVVDPLTYAFRAKEVPSVMYNAMFDRLIPRESTMQLWKALEYPKMLMYPGGHYSTVLFLGDVRQKVFQHFKTQLGG